jgi:hypothetical protein
MKEPICAYCRQQRDLTREHLWPASLHRRLMTLAEQKQNAFWLARLQKEIVGEPTIRDVCAICNNGVLSELDGYICALFDSVLYRVPAFDEVVSFEFDYHLLKRWLLKMSYNSARIHDSADMFALEAMLPYMLGQDDRLGKYTQLYLQMSYPEEVPEEERTEGWSDALYEPTHHRCGHILFRVPGVGQKMLRAVHLRAFGFYLAFFQPGEKSSVITHFDQVFTETMQGTVRLSPGPRRIEVRCNGIGAWKSVRDSRAVHFIFEDEP